MRSLKLLLRFPITGAMATRRMKLRWDGACSGCGETIPAKAEAVWDSDSKRATCLGCADRVGGGDTAAAPAPAVAPQPPPSIDVGSAGASAQRAFDKKAARVARKNERARADDEAWRSRVVGERPVLGRIATALTPRPAEQAISRSDRAWATGAQGERRVAESLELAAAEGVIALHDRKVPGSKANIDHIAVGPTGVYVIDAKKYSGKLETRDVGGLFRTDQRLFIAGRDRTKLVLAMEWQVAAVAKVVGDATPVHAILCSVSTDWSMLTIRPPVVRGVTVAWPKAMRKIVSQEGPLGAEEIESLARRIAKALPPA